MKTKFGIIIRSKHTGEEITLGSRFNTREKAEKGAEKQVCPRCDSFRIIPISEDAMWVDKNRGFVSSKYLKNES